ncbi:Branched-chain-amino-acid aminotransferase-like protein 2 [Holothuria leucospilota]|uniref:Branched-chain-amino-acid aminotransferase-like protein 2 n=1 Tax=Holothuria leucospilota TaxID=206669 RepID=A0A9Q1HLW3_HOLLE|nr:Branched-chain-amino-acid aminotransferase-like protein 2 [Holothuria leucospilota]
MDGADVWHQPYLNSFINHVNSSPELLQRYPKMKKTSREAEEASVRDGGTLQPLSVFSFINHVNSSPELLQRYPKMKKTSREAEEASVRDGGTLQPLSVFRYDWVQEQLEAPLKKEKKFLFVKDWPGAIDGHFNKLPKVPFKHTFIIRNPLRTAISFRKVCLKLFIHEGNIDEFNIIEGNPYTPIELPNPNHLHAFWQYVRNTIDPNPVVIDTDDLQNFPEQILRKYCEAVGIPFKTTYLKWDSGKETLKGVNGPLRLVSDQADVFVNAASSSCFLPVTSQPPSFESLTSDAQKYCSSLLPGYQEMYLSRIKPES